jgi:acyl-CoA synthetase (AMP-forming)/AMP-acid ligase II
VSGFDAPPLLLPDLIDRQSRWLGDKTALIAGAERRSWREFGAGVRRTASALRAAGVQPGDRIVVLMRNSLEMVEAMFGILRAGAVVVPLNVAVSDATAHAMIADCGARAVVASADHAARLASQPQSAVRLWICVDTPASAEESGLDWLDYQRVRDAAPAEPPDAGIGPEAICNIIYSSGTTGLPKGIVHSHRRRIDWARDLALALRYDSRAITLCPIGLYSNISWVGLLCTLVVGGTIVVEESFDVRRTFDVIAREKITHSSLVPVQFQRLLESPHFAAADLRSLRSLMCCGSPLPLAMKQRALSEFGCDFIELYGLTEGIITTLSPEDARLRPASVGLPLPGTDLRLIDESGREVQTGEAGEIVSRGHIAMLGYYNRPDADGEATWLDAQGRRWLRSGDIGRLDEAGFLYLVDRRKDMIISGGQNIYPADIEAVLVTHPMVAEVAVIGVPSERWGETPLALVVAAVTRTEATTAAAGLALAEELRDWVNARLGRQQRVSAVRFVDSLPRNPNGKILKRELRKTYAAAHG